MASLTIHMPINQALLVLKEFSPNKISNFAARNLLTRLGKHYANFREDDLTLPEVREAEQEQKSPAEVGYIIPDGSFVPILGEKGREYTENKLCVGFTDRDLKITRNRKDHERIEIKNKRFAMHLGKGVEAFAKNMSKMAIQKGVTFAKTLIYISDGAEYLKNICKKTFPTAIRILDWYHAIEHLHEAARKLFGEDAKEKCAEWVRPLKEQLWNGEILAVIADLQKQAYTWKGNSTAINDLIRYYFGNREAMDYANYRAKGYIIGSGSIESAQNYVVAIRTKLSGMIWSTRGIRAVLWLRCAFYEDQWDQFWSNLPLREAMAPP